MSEPMPLLAVGSIAFDTVKTPFGQAQDVLGGSAIYFSYAASFFTRVHLLGAVGDDFPEEHLRRLKDRSVDTSGVLRLPGKTFRWEGRYEGAMNAAETVSVEMNVFGKFKGEVPERLRSSPYLFLANGSPQLQQKIVEQMKCPRLVFCDTMNHWIESDRDSLEELLKKVDGIVINDEEARLLSGESNLPLAGRKIQSMGPRYVVIKKGEHGVIFLSGDNLFVLPAYPTADVIDPTGAGDSFAGGMMGYLAAEGSLNLSSFRKAIAYGTVLASINVEGFSLSRLEKTSLQEIGERFRRLQEVIRFWG